MGIIYVSFHQGQHLYHNANNLPLWTWWQPYWCLLHQEVEPIRYIKQHQDTLPLWHQGKRVDQDILPLRDALHMLNFLIMIPLSFYQNIWRMWNEVHDSIPQLCEYDLPITNDSYIHHSTNQVGIYQMFIHDWKNWNYYIILPMHSGDTNSIIVLYMTFTSNEIHGINNLWLR